MIKYTEIDISQDAANSLFNMLSSPTIMSIITGLMTGSYMIQTCIYDDNLFHRYYSELQLGDKLFRVRVGHLNSLVNKTIHVCVFKERTPWFGITHDFANRVSKLIMHNDLEKEEVDKYYSEQIKLLESY